MLFILHSRWWIKYNYSSEILHILELSSWYPGTIYIYIYIDLYLYPDEKESMSFGGSIQIHFVP